MAFDEASGGTLNYYSPHLLSKDTPGHNQWLDGDSHTVVGKSLQSVVTDEEASPWPMEVPSTSTTAVSTPRLQPSEVFGVDTHTKISKTTAAVCATKPTSEVGKHEKRVVRVGFLSAHFWWHSVGRLTVGLLERLGSSCGLEVFVIDVSINRRNSTAGGSSPTQRDNSGGHRRGDDFDFEGNTIIERLNAAGVTVVRSPAMVAGTGGATATTNDSAKPCNGTSNHALQKARETVAALKLDVLVYGDVGMDALTTGLAHGRLSPVQVAFWGHPSTTGLPTIDYFITSDLFEEELRGAGWAVKQVQNCSSSRRVSSSAAAKYVEHMTDTENIPDIAAANDAATTAADGQNTSFRGGTKKNNRQDAFSEQLVRLGGLGVVFDDPTRTFRWDPTCGDSGDNPGKDQLSRDSTHHHSEETDKEEGEVVGERQQQHKKGGGSNGRSEYAPPPPTSYYGRGVVDPATYTSPEAAVRKAAAASRHRPRLYVCAQSLMKMHPAFDAVLAGILAADPLAQVLLLRDSRQLLWHSRFRQRLREGIDAAEHRAATQHIAAAATATSIASGDKYTNATTAGVVDPPLSSSPPLVRSPQPGEFWSRVRFVGPLSGREFFRLQCRADVVLDPFPFGGGVTTLEVSVVKHPWLTFCPGFEGGERSEGRDVLGIVGKYM